MEGKRVIVGMSGGVDSAVTALLLKRQGYEVEGLTLLLHSDAGGARDARRVCDALGVRHSVLDLRERFAKNVVTPFVEQYRAGLTPNPCVFCNRSVKLAALGEHALERGAGHIATGHYARVALTEDGNPLLLRSRTIKKDQSYVLWAISRQLLSMLLLPLDGLEKDEVRSLAAQAGLDIAEKADSQDICFVPDGDYAAFLEARCPGGSVPGRFIDENGVDLGAHRGLWHYTVGQRKGLGRGFGKPMFVKSINAETGDVTLSGNDSLYSGSLIARDCNWLDREKPDAPTRFDVKIRYSSAAVPALASPLPGGQLMVEFSSPQRAVTPGQSAVFYTGDVLSGGGFIVRGTG